MSKHPFPTTTEALTDIRSAISKYILPGYVPPVPFLPASATALTMGSCFATTVNDALVRAGMRSAHLNVAETINTPAFTNMVIQNLLGADTASLGHIGNAVVSEQDRPALVDRMRRTAIFIVTVGVALQPFHSDGKPIFAVRKLAGSKTGFSGTNWRMLSVPEISAYLRSITAGLREINPQCNVVLTLSPIPLINSPSHPSVFGQDCVSKSNIRAALDEVTNEGTPNLYYWPSFEVVRWLGGHVGPFFGVDETDQRHVAARYIDLITSLFIESYFLPATSP